MLARDVFIVGLKSNELLAAASATVGGVSREFCLGVAVKATFAAFALAGGGRLLTATFHFEEDEPVRSLP
jgi:hypothetical protein